MDNKAEDLGVFLDIYKNNRWGNIESVSGPGSTWKSTELLRRNLVDFLTQFEIRNFVDAPCGDVNWISHLNYDFEKYTGIDIVPNLVSSLVDRNTFANKTYQVGNVCEVALPDADVVFCRDCLVHLPYDLALKAINNFKRGHFKYLLLTTFPEKVINQECSAGALRPLNLCISPFNLPQPIALLREYPEDMVSTYRDKCIGVWSQNQLT